MRLTQDTHLLQYKNKQCNPIIPYYKVIFYSNSSPYFEDVGHKLSQFL